MSAHGDKDQSAAEGRPDDRSLLKLTDAAIWDIEMGAPRATSEPTAFADNPAYFPFRPAFTALPWLHKARLEVVDRQNNGMNPPSWLVLSDAEEEGVFLMLRVGNASVEVYAVRRSRKTLDPGTAYDHVAWSNVGQITDAPGLLKALNSPWGGGRHVGD